MLDQDEANELLAAFDLGEYSSQNEQSILRGEDRDATLESLYGKFVDEAKQRMVSRTARSRGRGSATSK